MESLLAGGRCLKVIIVVLYRRKRPENRELLFFIAKNRIFNYIFYGNNMFLPSPGKNLRTPMYTSGHYSDVVVNLDLIILF